MGFFFSISGTGCPRKFTFLFLFAPAFFIARISNISFPSSAATLPMLLSFLICFSTGFASFLDSSPRISLTVPSTATKDASYRSQSCSMKFHHCPYLQSRATISSTRFSRSWLLLSSFSSFAFCSLSSASAASNFAYCSQRLLYFEYVSAAIFAAPKTPKTSHGACLRVLAAMSSAFRFCCATASSASAFSFITTSSCFSCSPLSSLHRVWCTALICEINRFPQYTIRSIAYFGFQCSFVDFNRSCSTSFSIFSAGCWCTNFVL
mmetsp:Transcript_9601/g.23559  ORF Transcript_9601/g.23559 Transcript_9601/m.23559 type:complete len:264 (+) Transcript_9601:207-998(+)